MKIELETQNDANSGGDAGDQITEAVPIEQGTYARKKKNYFFAIYLPLTQSNISGAYIVSMEIQEIIPLSSNSTHSPNTKSPGVSHDFLDFIPFKEVFLVIFLLAVVVYLLRK